MGIKSVPGEYGRRQPERQVVFAMNMASMAQFFVVFMIIWGMLPHICFFLCVLRFVWCCYRQLTVNEIASKAVAAGLTDPKHVVAFTLGFTSGSRDYCCLVFPNQWLYRSFSALIIFIFLAQSTKTGLYAASKKVAAKSKPKMYYFPLAGRGELIRFVISKAP